MGVQQLSKPAGIALGPAPFSTLSRSRRLNLTCLDRMLARLAISQPIQHHNPSPHQPPDQTPLVGSHLVSVHPPCSRKGPLLPACGLKCPRRVKRETTNSRFCVLRGLGGNFGGLHRPTDHLQSPAASGEALERARQEERQRPREVQKVRKRKREKRRG